MKSLYEELHSSENLKSAWERVRANRGCPGFDSISIDAFEKSIQENLDQLKTELEREEYNSLPLLRAFLTDEDGDQRPIAIPAVRDRVVQEALLNLLTPLFEPDFLDCSFAYRPSRSALQAISKVESYMAHDNEWVLHGDIESCFDRIDHNLLIGFLKEKIFDDKIINLVQKVIKSITFDRMKIESQPSGIPQGAVISPLLANIYLHRFDMSLINKGYNLVRYADDFLLLCDSEEKARRGLDDAQEALSQLKLQLNHQKTNIHYARDGFVFLGYHIDMNGKGPSKKALAAIEARLKEASKEEGALHLSERLERLDLIVRGWCNYFGGCIGIQPANFLVLLSLVRVSLERGNLEHAHKLLSRVNDFPWEGLKDSEVQAELIVLKQKLELTEPSLVEEGVTVAQDLAPLERQSLPGLVSCEKAPRAIGDPYSNISRLRQLLKNNPDYAEGYRELAESYAAIGQYGLAKKAYEKALELEPRIADTEKERLQIVATTEVSDITIELSDEQVELFLSLFEGREGVYARQWVDEQGRRGFSPVAGTLDREALQAHLKGSETLGIYQIRKDDTVRFMVIDVDVNKKVLLEYSKDKDRLHELTHLTHKDANRIVTVSTKMKIPSYIEDSGYKGRHCWFFFQEPIPAKFAREVARAIIQQAGPPSGGIHWEVFPNQDRVREGRLGCLIKLPLGLHKKSGRRCLFLDGDGCPFPDQAGILLRIQSIPKDTFHRIIQLTCLKGLGEEAGPNNLEPGSTQIEALLNGCNVVRRLIDKARDTSYLTHFERVTLLYTLGHLGDEGKALLHRVMGKTINYDYELTEKQIQKMKEYPISCARIREIHEDLLSQVACKCNLTPPPRGYPSPILHAFKIGAEVLKKKTREAPKVIKGKESLDKERGPDKGEKVGPLIHSTDSDEVNALLARYLGLKKQKWEIEKGLGELRSKIGEAFDRAKVEIVETEFGVLRRERQGKVASLIIEI